MNNGFKVQKRFEFLGKRNVNSNHYRHYSHSTSFSFSLFSMKRLRLTTTDKYLRKTDVSFQSKQVNEAIKDELRRGREPH